MTIKVFILKKRKQLLVDYTWYLIYYLLKKRGIRVVENPKNADYIFTTMMFFDFALKDLRYANKIKGKNTKIIAGGFESFNAGTYCHLTDYINVGEAFEFIEFLGERKNEPIQKVNSEIEELPYIYTKEKMETKKTVYPSYRIDWDDCVIARLTPEFYYYLGCKGCPYKCKFCATGHIQPYNVNKYKNFINAWKYVERMKHIEKERLYLGYISNEATYLKYLPNYIKPRAFSITLRQYLSDPIRFDSFMNHIGIEGFSEKARDFLAKPISNDEIRELFKITKERRRDVELFFIGALPIEDDMDEFLDTIPYDTDLYPKVYMKMTWLTYKPQTPMIKYKMKRDWEPLTREDLYLRFAQKNLRIRTFSLARPSASLINNFIYRVSGEEVDKLYKVKTYIDRNRKRIPVWDFDFCIDMIKKEGLNVDELFDKTETPSDNIRCDVRPTKIGLALMKGNVEEWINE